MSWVYSLSENMLRLGDEHGSFLEKFYPVTIRCVNIFSLDGLFYLSLPVIGQVKHQSRW